MRKIGIFIADDHAIFRSGLRSFLEKERGLAVVGEAGDGDETLTEIRKTHADVLLLDINMPGLGVAEVIRRASALKKPPAVLILTMHEEERYLREALAAGAKGFILKKSSATDLTGAIRAVASGNTWVDPALSEMLVSGLAPRKASEENSSSLTKRESEILRLLALGHTNEEIGKELFISKRTVETHRGHIMEKLGLKTRAELVRFAMEKGILE